MNETPVPRAFDARSPAYAINRVFRLANSRVQPRFELHNALNSAPILAINPRFGPAWQQVRTVLSPRLAKFALQIDF